MLYYEVIESRKYPGTWHAEAIKDDGSVLVAIFSGPDAEQRAYEYAEWKNNTVRQLEMARGAH